MDTSREYIEMLRKLAQQCYEVEEESFIQDGWKMQKGDYVVEYLLYHEECFLVTRAHIQNKTSEGVIIYNPNYIFKGIHIDIGLPDSEVLEKIQTRKTKKQNLIWLPRQDQLQEMVYYNGITGHLLNDFDRWYRIDSPQGVERWSFEQLWLAYVMKEKYGKVWNKEAWVKGFKEG